ncbi:MAG: pitrilysin family protein [Rhodanobacter sp.]
MKSTQNRTGMDALRLAVFAAIACTAGSALATSAPVPPAAGATFPATPPAPGPAPTLQLPTPATHTLANGLQVISVRRAGLPLVTAQLVVRSGGEMDPAKLAGLADLTAVLLTRGAAGRSAPQIADAAETLGGSLSADAGWDQSAVSLTVTTPRLPQALVLLASVVRQPDFSAAELKRAKTQAIDDVRLELSQPTALASLAASRSVFGAGAYGHARSGTPTSIARIRRADVQHLHDALYRPDNAILILAGDITPAQALALAQSSFGDWRKPEKALPPRPSGAAVGSLPALLMIDQRGAGQAGVVAAHAAPPRADADYYAGAVANAVLGGSYSARLNEEIRIKRGLSYGARSDLQPRRDAGVWLASAQTKNPSAPQVVDLLLGEFQRLGSTPVDDTELAARKATMIGAYGRSLETTAGLAARIAALAVYGIPLAEIGGYVAHVQAVTPQQVARYATAHLGADGVKVVVVGDASQFGPTMRKAHPQAQRLESTSLDLDSPTLQPRAATAHPQK